ncbi:MAG TPA: hypothetical protein VJA23_00590 [Candidatus Nanoarchaeia archaeon]|nr:hypothetical protein [Candidatus Nanoarchaeia archaeon]
MTQKQEISKDYRLNDIVLQLGLTDARFNTVELKLPGDGPVYDNAGKETIAGVVAGDFLFSAPYRVGKQALLARLDNFGGRVIFDAGFAEGTETMSEDRAKHYTIQYLRFNEFLSDTGHYGTRDPNAKVDILEIKTAIYDTPQPALDGGLPLNAFEVRGRLTKSLTVLDSFS